MKNVPMNSIPSEISSMKENPEKLLNTLKLLEKPLLMN